MTFEKKLYMTLKTKHFFRLVNILYGRILRIFVWELTLSLLVAVNAANTNTKNQTQEI